MQFPDREGRDFAIAFFLDHASIRFLSNQQAAKASVSFVMRSALRESKRVNVDRPSSLSIVIGNSESLAFNDQLGW